MARPLRIAFPGAFYHVTTRGNERKTVFKRKRDRERFLEYLETATERYHAVIHAYCLMDNHYHLLLDTPAGNLSQIMHHGNGAYTTYFNVKRARSGHLFQGRYKAILVEKDEYAKELSRYIHLNPVRAKMVEQPEQYEWTRYRFEPDALALVAAHCHGNRREIMNLETLLLGEAFYRNEKSVSVELFTGCDLIAYPDLMGTQISQRRPYHV